MGNRVTVSFSIRIDERIKDRLDKLASRRRRKRNWLIEQILGEKMGLDSYDWEETDLPEEGEVEGDH